jgi:hypothetical protein
LKKKTWILYLVVAALLIALLFYARHKIHFDWRVFFRQLQLANWPRIGLAVALIWMGYVVRTVRWALFLKPVRRVTLFSRLWFSVLGAQVIGFTGVALLGRPADLVRPYIIARRTGLAISSQVAVYVVERMFDLGAMALIFSTVLFFAPDRATLPHPELLRRIAFTGLFGTAALAILAISVRISGKAVAAMAERILGRLSHNLGKSVGAKISSFRDGLDMLASARDVATAFLYSVIMWGMIVMAYLETTRAFVDAPELHTITLARCMVLMAASMVASTIQLPVIGWFTQIAAVTAILQQLFQVAWEPALGCAAMLLVVSFLTIIPVGLAWARFDHVSLKEVSEESEEAGVSVMPGPSTSS